MKKIFVVLLACALLMGLCAIPAAAATAATAAADKTTADVNEEITITVTLSEVPDNCSKIAFSIDGWKTSVLKSFTYVSCTFAQGTLGNFNAKNGNVSRATDATMSEYFEDGLFCTLKLKVANKDAGTCAVTPVIKMTDASNAVLAQPTVNTISVTLGAAASTTPEIAGATVIFNEDFESRYVVKAADVTGKTVTFTINGEAATAEAVTIGGVEYIGATTPAVKPGAINTSFTVKLFVDGTEADSWTTSIEERLKAAAAGTDATLANAAKATLAFCQKAAEEVNNVAGTAYTEGVGTVDDHTYDAITPHGSGTGDVMIRGTSVYLKEGVFLNFYVDPQSYANTTNLKLKIGDTTYALNKTNGKYLVFSVPVELADMTTVFAATVVDGDTTVSNTYSNSVVAYAADIIADGNAALGQAIMNYVYYAQLATQGVG